jgi:hypothetical protein
MTKHSFPAIEMCSRICSAPFSQVQHPPPPYRDYKYMFTIQCGGEGGDVLGCVGDQILQYFCTLCMVPDSEPTKLLDHLKTKA